MGLGSSSHDDDVPDQYTGMTKKQKKAIQKSWKPLTKDRRKHGVTIFVRFFRQHPSYRRYFLDGPGVKMSDLARNPGVLAHCDAFMKTMDKYIYLLLHKPEALHDLGLYQVQIHVDMSIGESANKEMARTILEYLISEFPKEMTAYVIDCWRQFFELVIQEYLAYMEIIEAAEGKDTPIPVHASRKSTRDKEVEDAFWEKHREYWQNKRSTWDDTNAKSIEIDDEEHEDSYIDVRNKNSRCCGISPIFGGKEKNYPSHEKPPGGKEITEPRSSTTVKEEQTDVNDTGKSLAAEGAGLPTVNRRRSVAYSNVSSDVSRSLLDEYSTSEIMNSEPSPLDVRTRRASLSSDNKERRLTELFSIQDLPNEKSSRNSSYVPGRNIDDMDIPMPKCFKQSLNVTFDSDTRVYEDYSEETVADGPRERRRKWNEFTSCCNKAK